MALHINNNNPNSYRKFGDRSCSKYLLTRYLIIASKSRNRALKESVKVALDDLNKDRLRIRSAFHKGGLGYGRTGEHADPRVHVTVMRSTDGLYHYRFDKKGKRLIEIRR